jgi:chemosensory pili system protein ChpA (sensor histidine kinase/response regulator)
MTQAASDSLLWIKNELDNTLNFARQGLESYVEDEEQSGLERCLHGLAQVRGTLRMVEVFGGAMLAEEMEAICRAIAKGQMADEQPALEALTRSLLQLPDYLDRVVGGQPDMPLALLALINDMRAARGQPLLSESAMFARDISGRRIGQDVGPRAAPSGDIGAVAGKLRAKFQQALLGWYKHERSGKHLKVLARIAEKLEEAASSPPVFQLWWVVGGVLEALLDDGIEADVNLKQLLGRVDREIKRLAEDGEAACAEDPPHDLVHSLLYYVGRARSTGDRVTGIKDSFGLSELLPEAEAVEEASHGRSGPDSNLMRTVSVALKEDLARVKDTLDIYVRMGRDDVEEMAPLAELLRVARGEGHQAGGRPRDLIPVSAPGPKQAPPGGPYGACKGRYRFDLSHYSGRYPRALE